MIITELKKLTIFKNEKNKLQVATSDDIKEKLLNQLKEDICLFPQIKKSLFKTNAIILYDSTLNINGKKFIKKSKV